LTLLRARGYRITEARKAVLAAIENSDGWLRPEEILNRAKQDYPSIGLVTVYRTLSLLSELNCVRRIHMEDGCHGYAPATLEHSHHLVCRTCHRAIEVPGSEDLQPYLEDVSKSTGYLIEDHVLELVGVCMDCQESPPE
jgi:Fe2+ or Zn2+ uptake regulation protein